MNVIERFYNQLRNAIVERRSAPLPDVLFIIVIVIGCTIAYIMAALILVPSNKATAYHFGNERGAVTVLSAIFLAAASAFSLTSMVTLIRINDQHKWVWLVLAIGFAFLSFDELLRFHEQAGIFIGQFLGSGVFRNWNDVIVILYGVLAFPIFISLLPGLIRWRMVLEMFTIAFVFYGIHTVIDSINDPPTSYSVILEESAKLFCGAFLVIGSFIGFIGVLWKNRIFDLTNAR